MNFFLDVRNKNSLCSTQHGLKLSLKTCAEGVYLLNIVAWSGRAIQTSSCKYRSVRASSFERMLSVLPETQRISIIRNPVHATPQA